MKKFNIPNTHTLFKRRLISVFILLLLSPALASAADIHGQVLLQHRGLAKAQLTY